MIVDPSKSDLIPDANDWIDRRVKQFERAWREIGDANIDDYVGGAGALRVPLLVELIHADMEFRIRRGQATGIENYLERYSELANASGTVAELIWAEYHLRKMDQPDLTIETMLERLPSLREALRKTPISTGLTVRTSIDEEKHLEVPAELFRPEIPGYEIEEELGRGGMGIVYRATDLQLKRKVAIKLTLNGALSSTQEQLRFRREAEAIAALRHPQILQIFHVGTHEGQPFVVLELAPGGSLSRMLSGKPIDPDAAARLTEGLALAVAAAHAAGIVHRDLKPANVLLDDNGLAKIADFGLAKIVSAGVTQTKDDQLICTPSYTAPERVFGRELRSSISVDVYSLGAMLFEMLTGRPPYVGSSILDVLDQLRTGDVIAPSSLVPNIPIDLETICLKCLEREPTSRYASATDLAEDLSRFLNHHPVRARPVGISTKFWRWTRGNPVIAILSGSATFFLIAVTVVSVTVAILLAEYSRNERELRANAESLRREAQNNEQRSIVEAKAANESIRFLQELLELTDVMRAPDDLTAESTGSSKVDVTTRQIVEQGIKQIEQTLREHPLARARMLTAVGTTAFNVGMVIEARPLMIEAVQIFENIAQRESMEAVKAMVVLARIEAEKRDYDSAHLLFEKSKMVLRNLGSEESLAWADIGIYRTWMGLNWKNGDYVRDQRGDATRAVQIKTKLLGSMHPQTVIARTIAIIAGLAGNSDVSAVEQSLQKQWLEVKDIPSGDFVKAFLLDGLASLRQRVGKSNEASENIRLAMETMRRVIGDGNHPLMAIIYSDSAWISHCRGDQYTARLHQEKAVQMRELCSGDDSETRELTEEWIRQLEAAGESLMAKSILTRTVARTDLFSLANLDRAIPILQASSNYAVGKYAESIHLLNHYADHLEKSNSKWSALIENTAYMRATTECWRGNYASASSIYEWWLDKKRSLPGTTGLPPFKVLPWNTVSEQCGQLERSLQLRQEYEKMLSSQEDDFPQFHQDEWLAIFDLCVAMGKRPALLKKLEAWDAGWSHDKFPNHVCLGGLRLALAEQYLARGDTSKAMEFAQLAYRLLEKSLGHRANKTIDSMCLMARIHLAQGQFSEAIEWVQRAKDLTEQASGTEHPLTWARYRELSRIQCAADFADEAITLAKVSVEATQSTLGVYHSDYAESVANMALILISQRNLEQAAEILATACEEIRFKLLESNPSRILLEYLLLRVKTELPLTRTNDDSDAENRLQFMKTHLESAWHESDWRLKQSFPSQFKVSGVVRAKRHSFCSGKLHAVR